MLDTCNRFIARRCLYLVCNPGGEAGRSIEMTERLARFERLLIDALTEVLMDVGLDPLPEWGTPWLMGDGPGRVEGPQPTFRIRFVWHGPRQPVSAGFKSLKAVGARLEVVDVGSRRELVLEVESTRLVSAFNDLVPR